ncbi:MAG: flagellar biosynthesis anti-sigma factor FlgM [Planctomycetes bacterium]|nr:flagellar biosynthesis anti-sigma factor FlgM [Planctomycetota bacterium]
MSNINGINGYGGPNAIPPGGPRGSQPPPVPIPPADEPDQVEISSVARYLQKIAMLPEMRTEKVQSARQALEQGVFDVDGKLSHALDNFLDEYFPT